MIPTRYFLALPLSLICACSSLAQTTSPGDAKLALNAALVLTPEFCAANKNIVLGNVFPPALCAELEGALKGVFSNLTRVTAASPLEAGKAEVVLLPRLVDARTGGAKFGSLSKQEVTVVLEWTVKDTSGRTLWINTVEASISDHPGTMFTYKEKQKLAAEHLSKNVAAQSAGKIAAAPELRQFTQLAQQPRPVLETARTNQAPPATLPGALVPTANDDPNRYTLEYVHSDRKWKHGTPARTDTYDEISEIFQTQMVAEMERKHFHRGTPSDRVCCKLTVEILTVKAVNNSLVKNPLSTKAPGVDVTASVKFTDAGGKLVYTKEYRGEGTVAPYGVEKERAVMQRAVGVLARNVTVDESFDQAITKALNAGAR